MPYIAFDLDAMERAPEVAKAIGMSVGDAAWGLLQMWRWCWREKKATVTSTHLRGFFGSNTEVMAALEAFGFVERGLGDEYRVRGADRYLRLAEGRSKGGKAASKAGNLKRGKQKPAGGGCWDSAGEKTEGAGEVLEKSSSTFPGLSASSEQRAANIKEATTPAKKPPAASIVLSDQMLADFKVARGSAYLFSAGPDGTALAALRKVASDPEIARRWSVGIRSAGWLQINSIAQLRSKWNDLAAPATGPPPKPAYVPARQKTIEELYPIQPPAKANQ